MFWSSNYKLARIYPKENDGYSTETLLKNILCKAVHSAEQWKASWLFTNKELVT